MYSFVVVCVQFVIATCQLLATKRGEEFVVVFGVVKGMCVHVDLVERQSCKYIVPYSGKLSPVQNFTELSSRLSEGTFMILNFVPALKQDHTHSNDEHTHTRHYVEILWFLHMYFHGS